MNDILSVARPIIYRMVLIFHSFSILILSYTWQRCIYTYCDEYYLLCHNVLTLRRLGKSRLPFSCHYQLVIEA